MTTAKRSRAAELSRPQLELAEMLDRTLGTGVVVAGDVTLSVADVELVYLNLRALLASVATLENRGVPFPRHGGRGVDRGPGMRSRASAPAGAPDRRHAPSRPLEARALPAAAPYIEPATANDDERLERGLAQLVLTVVELLRRLMERQALRRVEAGQLDEERVDRLGRAFERLERQMDELKARFELDDDDLALRLGPLPGLDDLASEV